MSEKQLRADLVRLAKRDPEIRKALQPLLKTAFDVSALVQWATPIALALKGKVVRDVYGHDIVHIRYDIRLRGYKTLTFSLKPTGKVHILFKEDKYADQVKLGEVDFVKLTYVSKGTFEQETMALLRRVDKG